MSRNVTLSKKESDILQMACDRVIDYYKQRAPQTSQGNVNPVMSTSKASVAQKKAPQTSQKCIVNPVVSKASAAPKDDGGAIHTRTRQKTSASFKKAHRPPSGRASPMPSFKKMPRAASGGTSPMPSFKKTQRAPSGRASSVPTLGKDSGVPIGKKRKRQSPPSSGKKEVKPTPSGKVTATLSTEPKRIRGKKQPKEEVGDKEIIVISSGSD